MSRDLIQSDCVKRDHDHAFPPSLWALAIEGIVCNVTILFRFVFLYQVWCGLTNIGEMIAVKQVELNHSNLDEAEEVLLV